MLGFPGDLLIHVFSALRRGRWGLIINNSETRRWMVESEPTAIPGEVGYSGSRVGKLHPI